MKLIKPSFEIITQESGMNGLLRHIELCGRTAYKSESEIKEDSANKFVDMLINRGHGAVLEHGTVYLQFSDYNIREDFNRHSLINDYESNKYSIIKFGLSTYYVTTNYRVLVENDWLKDLQYQCEPTEFHKKRITVKFICDRGVSHEFVRHRVFSFCQESTRYCNYSKNKFGNELTFILPCWFKTISVGSIRGTSSICVDDLDLSKEIRFANLLVESQSTYLALLEEGWVPQQARSVLPNSLKTELLMTGTIEQWKGFFKLRCAKDAHPQARELAIPLEEKFKELGYVE